MAKIRISENVLRDAHQSLHATRMVTSDMLPIAKQLDKAGFWSLESWGGATFDSCIRFLNEDPWERMRQLKKAMPNTPHQMLLRGQSILGYRHYADDVVEKCVERMAINGVDVFRVFDALNDPRKIYAANGKLLPHLLFRAVLAVRLDLNDHLAPGLLLHKVCKILRALRSGVPGGLVVGIGQHIVRCGLRLCTTACQLQGCKAQPG